MLFWQTLSGYTVVEISTFLHPHVLNPSAPSRIFHRSHHSPINPWFQPRHVLAPDRFDKIFNQKKEDALSQLRSYESLVNQNLSSLDGKKKELNDRIEQAKKKGLQDAPKGLFKN